MASGGPRPRANFYTRNKNLVHAPEWFKAFGDAVARACWERWYVSGTRGARRLRSRFTDKERGGYEKLFRVGTGVTVRFMEIDATSGRPRHPVFKGVRTDV
jgi:hypothetical protein